MIYRFILSRYIYFFIVIVIVVSNIIVVIVFNIILKVIGKKVYRERGGVWEI